jgi:hypothetical protein
MSRSPKLKKSVVKRSRKRTARRKLRTSSPRSNSKSTSIERLQRLPIDVLDKAITYLPDASALARTTRSSRLPELSGVHAKEDFNLIRKRHLNKLCQISEEESARIPVDKLMDHLEKIIKIVKGRNREEFYTGKVTVPIPPMKTWGDHRVNTTKSDSPIVICIARIMTSISRRLRRLIHQNSPDFTAMRARYLPIVVDIITLIKEGTLPTIPVALADIDRNDTQSFKDLQDEVFHIQEYLRMIFINHSMLFRELTDLLEEWYVSQLPIVDFFKRETPPPEARSLTQRIKSLCTFGSCRRQ